MNKNKYTHLNTIYYIIITDRIVEVKLKNVNVLMWRNLILYLYFIFIFYFLPNDYDTISIFEKT